MTQDENPNHARHRIERGARASDSPANPVDHSGPVLRTPGDAATVIIGAPVVVAVAVVCVAGFVAAVAGFWIWAVGYLAVALPRAIFRRGSGPSKLTAADWGDVYARRDADIYERRADR